MTRTRRRLSLALLSLGPLLTQGCTVEKPAPAPVVNAPPNEPNPAAPKAAPAPLPETGKRPPAFLSAKKLDPSKAAELVQDAIRAAQLGRMPIAIRMLDDALEMDPQNREALRLLAQMTQQAASEMQRPQNSPLFLRSADALRKLRAAYPQLNEDEKRFLPQVFYNEGCTFAISGETDRALKSIGEAIDAGLNQPSILDTDPELDSLRKLPAFHALQARVEKESVAALMAAAKPYPFDFRLPDLTGKPVSLADVKGDVTLVDFWGTWCVPCRKSIPHLLEISKKYRDRGVRVVGLTYEQEVGDAAKKLIRQTIEAVGITYPCLIGDDATKEKLPEFPGYPTLLVLDKTGTVRVQLNGYQPLGAVEAAVNAVLDQQAPRPAAASKKEAPAKAKAASTPK
ncbi:MAG: redoxin domain-containing protein [Isosphaeraceae bacterium]